MAAKKPVTKKSAPKKTAARSKSSVKKTSAKKKNGTAKKTASLTKSRLSLEARYLKVQRAAYYIAEDSNRLRDPVECWIETEKQVSSQGASSRR